jgi:hypothetical protein
MLSRKYRSCVTATTVPLYSRRKPSSHATESASRWLVGFVFCVCVCVCVCVRRQSVCGLVRSLHLQFGRGQEMIGTTFTSSSSSSSSTNRRE